ncbi:hypothetical protein ROHU_008066 [Labeo rohita]|uniref:LRR and PYD domains-containing 3-like protein n=1 Tax=Labeo rohita TaxID=84645 RepID=A0A498M8F0_LABRO|nr:hypothetical protein ROHU_008066 [Labeo rohita]
MNSILQGTNSHLMTENNQLQERFNDLSDELKKAYLKGWFSGRFFLSNVLKTWSESRQYCRDQGGDLVIIKTEMKQKSATEYLRNARKNLVTNMKNLPLIIENLYQKNVFNDYEVDDLKAEKTEFDKARSILDWVIKKGDIASYKFLQILDVTKKRTLDPGLHYWISCFPFRDEDTEASYSFGTKPCQNYQTQLKQRAKSILKKQRGRFCKYLGKKHVNFSFIPLVLETDSVVKTPQCKINLKNKKCKKLRPKKLRAYIPNEGQTLSPEDLLKCRNKNILITGKPGVGKTTVVQEMLRLWAEKDDREIDYMFYFVLAHNSVASLESLLFDVYSKPMEEDRKEVFQDIEKNSENVVIVFDCVMDLEENSILWKIMNHDLLPDAKIVITCRSEVEDDPLFSDWPTRRVYVQGFSGKSIKAYYQSMLGHDPVHLDVILKNQELFSLSHVPMYAFMVAAFISFKNDTKNNHPHTVTEMYIHIFRLTMMKHGGKEIKEIDKYLREIKYKIHPLMENAFSATMQKTLNLNSCETDICHAFLKNITLQDSVSSATTYCAFHHNTMQEFFSALWLLGHPDEIEKVLQLCQTEEHKHMRHVLPFLCGLLSEHNIKLLKCLFPEDQIKKTSDWLIEKFLDTFLQPQSESEEFDLLYVCQCLYELQSPKACLMFLEKMDHRLEPEVDLDPHQCCAFSYVIGQSRDKEVYVNLEDCNVTDVGMDMMLSCSPNIRLSDLSDSDLSKFLLQLFIKAAEIETQTGEQMLKLLSSVCTSSTDYEWTYIFYQSDFLLDLCSHVKNYETQTGRSFLPALQSVFQSPDIWILDLSQRKSSVLLEVLKLQTQKKPVDLRGCSEEESEVKSFLQCLPYISQLRFWEIDDEETRMSAVRFLLNLCVAAVKNDKDAGTRFLTHLSYVCSYKTFPFDEEFGDCDADYQSDFLLDLWSHVKNYETQTGRSFLPALQSVFQSPDVWIIDLSQRKSSVLLEVLKLQTQKKPVDLRGCSKSEVKSFLQCLPYISQLGYKTFPFLEEFGDADVQSNFLLDLWSHVKNYETQTGRSFLPALQMSSVFMLCVIREVYESGSAGFVSGLLSSVENYINLQCRDLDSVHCDALRFTLQHCTAASLNLQWTSIPEEELESILPLFTHVSHLSVDRRLLLKMLHCCSVSDVQQEAASVLLSVLQHKLDFSCHSALDLTTNTDSEPLRLTADDCRATSRVIQRAHSDTKTQLILQDCEIHTAGMDELFTVLHSVQLCCDKSLLLQFLAHVRPEEAESLSGALGEELDLSQTQLDPQVCRGLVLILEYCEGLTELDLSQCRLTDHSLDLLLPNLHKVQNIDFSGNNITDAGAQKIHSIVTRNSNIKTVRLFNNRIESREIFSTDPQFEIW